MARFGILKSVIIIYFFLAISNVLYSQCNGIIKEGSYAHIRIGDTFKKKNLKFFGEYRTKQRLHNPIEKYPKISRTIYLCNSSIIINAERQRYFSACIINNITIKYPNKSKTAKGIIIGESSFKDVVNIYGTPNYQDNNRLQYYYLGLTFIYGDTTLTEGENNYIRIKEHNLNDKIISINIYHPLPDNK